MVEMVHDRIAAGDTTVVSTAAVLRCGKQMENLPHYNFSWTISLQKTEKLSLEEAMDLSRDRIILELEYSVCICCGKPHGITTIPLLHIGDEAPRNAAFLTAHKQFMLRAFQSRIYWGRDIMCMKQAPTGDVMSLRPHVSPTKLTPLLEK
jgi:hypothetical protein